ncbi:hypothetical protein BKA70DRAFT_1416242 [Coprinopsis sp. MPI-PUGE-AT-0042]|nr:hypothetical protein BKA70DRAFT_1416242 [Coprinopsis sp. MPI-PUGE-AT-0042]
MAPHCFPNASPNPLDSPRPQPTLLPTISPSHNPCRNPDRYHRGSYLWFQSGDSSRGLEAFKNIGRRSADRLMPPGGYPKLTDLIRQEKEGTGMRGDPELLSTITSATDEEIALKAELAKAEVEAVAYASASTIPVGSMTTTNSPAPLPTMSHWRSSHPSHPNPLAGLKVNPPSSSPLLSPPRYQTLGLLPFTVAQRFHPMRSYCSTTPLWRNRNDLTPQITRASKPNNVHLNDSSPLSDFPSLPYLPSSMDSSSSAECNTNGDVPR